MKQQHIIKSARRFNLPEVGQMISFNITCKTYFALIVVDDTKAQRFYGNKIYLRTGNKPTNFCIKNTVSAQQYDLFSFVTKRNLQIVWRHNKIFFYNFFFIFRWTSTTPRIFNSWHYVNCIGTIYTSFLHTNSINPVSG